MTRRPVKTESYVWCDHHGEVHAARPDFYQEGAIWPDESPCNPANWRSVYVLGERGEVF